MTFKEDKNVPQYSIIQWNGVRFDPGNNYKKMTGAYTVPYNGYYQFSITARTRSQDYIQYRISVDGIPVHYCWEHISNGSHGQTSCSMILKLYAGQKVQIQTTSSTVIQALGSNGELHSWFDGHMLFPFWKIDQTDISYNDDEKLQINEFGCCN